MGDTLFRVHRYYFTRESQIFADMFSLPTGGTGTPSGTMEGKSDSSPIEIPGVTKLEMESFLGFVYFGYAFTLYRDPCIDKGDRMHDENTFTLESWINLLSFSTRFICDKIRSRSIREIEAIQSRVDPVERIVLAARHNVPQWLNGAYQELCQRQETLTEAEGEKLGLSTVIKLMRAREILLSGSDLQDRFLSNKFGRSSGISSTALARTQPPDLGPVRPSPISDWWGLPQPQALELRFEPQRVADVVRDVFALDATPSL